MNHIDNFFARFKKAFVGNSNKKEAIAASCMSHAGLNVTPEQIEIKGQIVRLNISPAAKSNLFMKKADILADINQKIKPDISDIH
ncbi:MAG TPA: hypothetical protein VK145_00820 [Candidatus Nanoarchaeia archaeon]|nr:hypothetical protein [Candidatus Nanoarchaeia archaeon]